MKTKDFINHLLANVTVDNARVIELVNAFTGNDTDNAMRILSYLTGFCNLPEVATTSNIAKDARLVSYDFFTNRVTYKYIRTAEVGIEEGHVDDITSDVYESRDAIPHKDWTSKGVKVVVKYWDTNECDLSKWEK